MSETSTIAARLFSADEASCQLEDMLSKAGVEFTSIGWDQYDLSLEIHGVPVADRLIDAAKKLCAEAGFAKIYVNHVDRWETHYSIKDGVVSDGWRVSYPHKRAEGATGILVEQPVKSWPREWFESGYACVVEPSRPLGKRSRRNEERN